MEKTWLDFNAWLKNRFGRRVQKITVDAGLTCPNRDGTVGTGGCIYCNARGSGTGAMAAGIGVAEQVRRGAEAMARRYKAKKFIAYFQSFSNTYAPVDRLRRLYDAALSVPDVVGLSVGTRPDCVDREKIDLLAGYAESRMVWVEYGLQSAHDATLARINRGHDFGCFREAVALTRNRGIFICAHVILGLPGEDPRAMMETADAVAALGMDGIKIHLLYVTRGTALERLYASGGYRPLEQDEYADLVVDFIRRLPPGMVIQRVTGDPHPEELVAPEWALCKRENLALIRERFSSYTIRPFKETST